MTTSKPVNWTYSRYWGIFTRSDTKELAGYGYSGDVTHFNQAEYSTLPKQGPLPSGTYRLYYEESNPKLGPHVFSLVPIGLFPMYGRGGFYIHGDNSEANHTGSEGCIVAPLCVRNIFEDGDILTVV